MKIFSPVARGNGAFVVHQSLERSISGYFVKGYHHYLTLFPALLPLISIGERNFNLIHTTPDHAIFFHQKYVPLVITFHNYVLDRWMKQYSTPLQNIHYKTDLKLFIRLAFEKADCITAVSKYTAQLVRKELGTTRDIKVIYNGVDTNFFHPVKKCSVKKEIRVLFSGNISKRKGAHWLPELGRKLGDPFKIYYTSGPRTEKKYPFLNDNLISLGHIPYRRMPAIYQQMDILIMPTVREGLCLTIAEAMACGLPVIASNCSSNPELIDNFRGGFLCPVGDMNAFAEKITILAESNQLRREMGEYNRAKVEKHFKLIDMVAKYRTLFKKICHQKRFI